ncbi:MAG: rRNA maturation RNase YbeY [Candidatus Auribacter fodinae]|jgi:probable rRNA maturation factor|uniref:Endoribonuclease YbeY n=1 Tax=Candidatus Auribacter fodinae TaxID=2093366 RepID=A0A3A4R9U6_9BACT|nr:MAG: rRNA maturation RNase YbeY [Candidatus Auribacter fodinae]
MKIRISNRQKRFQIYPSTIKNICAEVLTCEGEPESVELDVSIVSDEEIEQLNEQYLQHTGPTDVLSFSQREGDDVDGLDDQIGDVVVSADRAFEQSAIFDTSFNEEFALYIIHGILHLLGYDDTTDEDKDCMEKRQQYLLQKLVRAGGSIQLISDQTEG